VSRYLIFRLRVITPARLHFIRASGEPCRFMRTSSFMFPITKCVRVHHPSRSLIRSVETMSLEQARFAVSRTPLNQIGSQIVLERNQTSDPQPAIWLSMDVAPSNSEAEDIKTSRSAPPRQQRHMPRSQFGFARVRVNFCSPLSAFSLTLALDHGYPGCGQFRSA